MQTEITTLEQEITLKSGEKRIRNIIMLKVTLAKDVIPDVIDIHNGGY